MAFGIPETDRIASRKSSKIFRLPEGVGTQRNKTPTSKLQHLHNTFNRPDLSSPVTPQKGGGKR
jgi:hypothetical protein